MTSQETRDELTRLLAAVTPGEWFQWTTTGDVSSTELDCMIFQATLRDSNGRVSAQGNANCAMVVAAKNALPTLLADSAKLAEVEAERDKYRTALERIAKPALGGKEQQYAARDALAKPADRSEP